MKKQRRLFYLAVLVLMIGVWVLPVLPVKAEDNFCGENGGENITWTRNGDGADLTLTLTGSGRMGDYLSGADCPWASTTVRNTQRIVIDNNITYIGNYAFYGHEQVKGTLDLPDKLEGIGECAFNHCKWYNSELAFPETLKTIGDSAFAYFATMNIPEDPSLTLTFPKSVNSVGADAFEGYSAGVDRVYIKNPAMVMGENCLGDSKTLKIYGAAGSTAEAYATAHGLEFFVWDGTSTYYTVTFDSNGADTGAIPQQKIQIGDKATEPTEPVREGYYFEGWFLGDEKYDFREAVHRDITLTARWAKVTVSGKAPVLTLRNDSLYDIVLTWKNNDNAGLLRYEIYRASIEKGEDAESGQYVKIYTAGAADNTYIDDTDCTYEKTKYHYKIKAIYKGGRETPFSNVVSTAGIMYGSPANLDKNCVGVNLTDAEGNVLDSLTLHKGESSPELHLQLTYQNGSKKDFKDLKKQKGGYPFLSWDIESENDPAYEDCARFLPTMDYLGINPDTATCTAKLYGEKVVPGGAQKYISITFQLTDGPCVIWIPFTVIAAEPGVDYGEPETLETFSDSNALWQSVKTSFRNRERSFGVLLDMEVYNREYGYGDKYEDGYYAICKPLSDDIDRRVFDFYEERTGMSSWEGDYLNEGIKSYQAHETEIYYGEGRYKSLWFSEVNYYTTKEQEDWMDAEIDRMVNQTDGMFYSYKDKSDYEKVKAVYDYVSTKIKWVDGTKVGLYHMAYSGLHDGVGTCQSYALLFYRLTRELGVPSRVLMGTDAGAHTYNIVKLGSRWYYIDCSNKRFLQGSKTFKTTTLQAIWRGKEFQNNYIKKISLYNYGGGQTSGIKSITALKSNEIEGLDSNLTGAADKMAATYKISGDKITAQNVSKKVLLPVYGCSAYLGAEKNGDAFKQQGYFLAFRINVDKSKVTADGRITISYDLDGEEIEKEYTALGSSMKEKGYVDVILKLSEGSQNITVAVDFDTNGDDSDYQEKKYSLQVSSLKKQAAERFGALKEITDKNNSCGVETSAPKIKSEKSGENITVTYDSLAYSTKVQLPEKDAAEGYYAAVQVETPEAMKGTSIPERVSAQLENGGRIKDFYYAMSADKSCIRLYFRTDKDTKSSLGTLDIIWTENDVQKITIQTADQCVFETLDPAARLAKSVKFNGVAATMYTGQSQIADTTIVRNYERDRVHLVFTSSDSHVVSVNRVTGELKALKPGTATVTVTATDASGAVATDKKGKILKGLTASVKITVKAPTAPGSLKLTEISDTSAVMNWKANTTGQYIEVYAVPVNKTVMGKNKNTWKTAIEAALKKAGMDSRLLLDMNAGEMQTLRQTLETELSVQEGSCAVARDSSSGKSVSLAGLQKNTGYAFYVRNAAKNEIGNIYFTGAVIGETKTKTTVLTDVTLSAKNADGDTLESVSFTEGQKPVIEIVAGASASEEIPAQLSYLVSAEGSAYTGAAYKSTNAQVMKVDKKGKLTLGAQAGTAELYVTGKDSAGKVRESGRIQVRVIRDPKKLVNKSTTLALGGSVKLRDLIGYSTKGTSTEVDVTNVDFGAVLAELEGTECFEIAEGEKTEDSVITAAAFLTDAKGNKKTGNSIKIPVSLYAGSTHEDEEKPLSTAYATIKVTDMALPVITKTVPMDTSVTLKFKPNATVRWYEGKATLNYSYTVTVIDKATKEETKISPENIVFSEGSDSTTKAPLYTCVVKGLSADWNYNVKVTACYDAQGLGIVAASKDSAVKSFKTLKPLLKKADGDDQIPINYISLPDLRKDASAEGARVTETITLKNNETYILMAQVDKYNRVLGTDKLKWTITSSIKNMATVKATSDTYQAQLNTLRTGTFKVTVTSTVSKEVLAVFDVTVVPYQTTME